ncbi:heavy-metal-associated domain-containing protein [Kocuria nitroreducens]|uniref:heavy-metal-associated domain-containing protein n=1 Tax=Kocuria nitroreducens TaxID=3058914 RepID=UPI0036D9450C
MNAAGRLGVYAAGVAVVFTGAFAAAGAVVPEDAVTAWTQQTEGAQHPEDGHEEEAVPAASAGTAPEESPVRGVAVEQGGYLLQEVSAPEAAGEEKELSFTITGPDKAAVTDFETSHEKKAHLIVVRSDGTGYRHVHPVMDEAGRWSIPWQWEVAGTYRIYADITPAGAGENLTLTRTVEVAGALEPAAPTVSATDEVHGFEVSVEGELSAGSASELTLNVTRDGQPVTTLEPYLGAYGHLVALREGDLAYLHVHPDGAEPVAGEVSGPGVEFATTAPTPGRYYLYFDFQVDGKVHTAQFALDTTESTDTAADEHSGH